MDIDSSEYKTSLWSYNSRARYETCDVSSNCEGSFSCCYSGKYTTWYSYSSGYSYSYYGVQNTCDYAAGCRQHQPKAEIWPWIVFIIVIGLCRVFIICNKHKRAN